MKIMFSAVGQKVSTNVNPDGGDNIEGIQGQRGGGG